LSVCLLSHSEAARLENWNIWPICKAHRHISRAKAEVLVQENDARWIGGAHTKVQGPVTMIVPTFLQGRTWKPVGPRLGVRVWQFVPDK
jgi:hypothetical protein